MTAETLKPFIPPTTDAFPSKKSNNECCLFNKKHLPIGLSAIALVLAIGLLGALQWNLYRMQQIQKEVTSLNNVVEKLQKQLGLNYLEDIAEFNNSYDNALIEDDDEEEDEDEDDDPDDDEDDDDLTNGMLPDYTDEDVDNEEEKRPNEDEDDSDDDEESFKEYTDLLEKFRKDYSNIHDEDDEDLGTESEDSEDPNVFKDFEKFKNSKKRKESRKTRAIAQNENAFKLLENDEPKAKANYESLGLRGSHKRHIVSERLPGRSRTSRMRKLLPLKKSGDSLLSAKSIALPMTLMEKPAAHFHLNRKVPDRHTNFKVDSYPGDMYIGHPSWTNEINIDQYFHVDQGVLFVREPGLYYVYAQVCYNNSHNQNGFIIFHGHKPFLQCLNTVPTNLPLKIHTCHTSGLIYLKANDSIHLRDFHSDRDAVLRETNNRSYFGLIKI